MTIYRYADLDKKVEDGLASTCISVNGARIIIPTACDQIVGFTNPDDLDVDLLARWKQGERGPEFENQKLQPGDCLVMYNNGRNINELLMQEPDWHKSPEGIRRMIDRLYSCAESGGKNTEPAIWNSDLNWAKSAHLTTTAGQEVTDEVWGKNAGVALEAVKSPVEQNFIHVKPGDKLISPDGIVQTAGAMSAIAVQQPDNTWNIVQLNAKGYAVVRENTRAMENEEQPKKRTGLSKTMEELQEKQERLDEVSEKPRTALEKAVRNGLRSPDKIMEMRKRIEEARLKETRKRYGLPPKGSSR